MNIDWDKEIKALRVRKRNGLMCTNVFAEQMAWAEKQKASQHGGVNMRMEESARARIDLASARAKVIQAAKEVGEEEDMQASFEVLWQLGSDLHNRLETYRIPE